MVGAPWLEYMEALASVAPHGGGQNSPGWALVAFYADVFFCPEAQGAVLQSGPGTLW